MEVIADINWTAALEVCLQLRELIAILFVTVVRLTALMISWIARLLQVTSSTRISLCLHH